MEHGKCYNCSEQYLMEHKDDTFADKQAAETIMSTNNPVIQKQTRVNKFNGELWKQIAPDIMKKALVLKFSQNPELKQKLMDTGDRYIGEASPHDDFWGCGLSMNDANVGNYTKWTGQNILGKVLMEVREELK